MIYQNGHRVIIVYCLENKYGQSPCIIDGRSVVFPEGYKYGFMNPSRFKEKDYRRFFYQFSMYEYVLDLSALVYDTGEVLFTEKDILSKTKIRR